MDVFVLRAGAFIDSITRISRRDGRIRSLNLSTKAAGIDIDDTTGGIVALESGLNGVTAFDMDFNVGTRVGFKNLALAQPASSAPLFSIDQATGDYYVSAEGARSWTRYPKASGLRMGRSVSVAGTIQRMMPGAQGTVFVQDTNGLLQTYDQTGQAVATDFSGMTAAGPFCVARSFSMYRPGEMLGTGWENVLPVGNEP